MRSVKGYGMSDECIRRMHSYTGGKLREISGHLMCQFFPGNDAVWTLPRSLGGRHFGNAVYSEVLIDQLEDLHEPIVLEPCLYETDVGNVSIHYDLIRLHNSQDDYLLSLKSKARSQLKRYVGEYKVERVAGAIYAGMFRAYAALIDANMSVPVDGDEPNGTWAFLLTQTDPSQPSLHGTDLLRVSDANGVLADVFVSVSDSTLHTVAPIPYRPKSMARIHYALLSYARDCGHQYLDIDNVSEGFRFAYKQPMMNASDTFLCWANRAGREYLKSNRDQAPWVVEIYNQLVERTPCTTEI